MNKVQVTVTSVISVNPKSLLYVYALHKVAEILYLLCMLLFYLLGFLIVVEVFFFNKIV